MTDMKCDCGGELKMESRTVRMTRMRDSILAGGLAQGYAHCPEKTDG